MKKWNVTLRLATKSVPEKITFAGTVVTSMTENIELFPKPTPDLKTISRLAEDLQLAYEISRDGSKKATSIMNTKVFELDVQLSALGSYVTIIANNNADVGDTVIISAGMEVRQTSDRAPQEFAVENTEFTGEVFVTSKSEERASYVWEYSVDQLTWSSCSITRVANTIIDNLTPGNRYYFRVALVTERQGPWQGPISIIVT